MAGAEAFEFREEFSLAPLGLLGGQDEISIAVAFARPRVIRSLVGHGRVGVLGRVADDLRARGDGECAQSGGSQREGGAEEDESEASVSLH